MPPPLRAWRGYQVLPAQEVYFDGEAAAAEAFCSTIWPSSPILTLSGAFTGMIVARQIDRAFGRDALRQTIALGPVDFFGKYIDAQPLHTWTRKKQ